MNRGSTRLIVAGVFFALACAHGGGATRVGGGGVAPAAVVDPLLGAVPRCARDHSQAIEPARLSVLAVGTPVSLRGVLVPASVSCTMKACFQIDPVGGGSQRVACCNACDAYLELRPTNPAGAPASAAPAVRVRLAGKASPLAWGGQDCEVAGAIAQPHAEVIAAGVLAAARDDEAGRRVIVLDRAALCATGAWPAPSTSPR